MLPLCITFICYSLSDSSGDEECDDSDPGSNDGYDYGYEDDTEEKQFANEYFMKKRWAEKEAAIRAEKLAQISKTAGILPTIGRSSCTGSRVRGSITPSICSAMRHDE